jgi:hypothetical protein
MANINEKPVTQQEVLAALADLGVEIEDGKICATELASALTEVTADWDKWPRGWTR